MVGERSDTRVLAEEEATPSPLLTIVVPTRNEAGNVRVLVERIERSVHIRHEILFVDDSEDDTPSKVEELASQYAPTRIRIHHREPDKRAGGLGGAVVEGYRLAKGEWACVIDADLQHPPELISRLVAAASSERADVAIASRYVEGGEQAGLSGLRASVSEASCSLARILFRNRLRHVTDPMSGFFVVRRRAIDLDRLEPRGFKLLLELLLSHNNLRVTEVPYTFGRRLEGESKASLREGFNFALLLVHRRLGSTLVRALGFMLVGASGIAVNSAVLVALTELAAIHYLLSAVVATQVSSTWNFVLAERFVFSGRSKLADRAGRWLAFVAMNNAALTFRAPMLYVLTSVVGIQYAASNILSLGTMTAIRFIISDSVIWRSSQRKEYLYNIHNLVSVSSTTRLPELERFRTQELVEDPTISVRPGYPRRTNLSSETPTFLRRSLFYSDGLGALGFAINVTVADGRTAVIASPLLMHSPHVLYTNVVEPILRWTFVGRGYALVHGACLSDGAEAFIVTAKTDTGKTTTVLRILDAHTVHFVSDDLTLIDEFGNVFPYPKPLTISRHTLAAVRTPLLKPLERFFLIVQSRVHSRSGRLFAKVIARTHLPAASINAVAQLLIPPPKYDVSRLIPDVTVSETSTLGRMFVIERGPVDLTEHLDEVQAIETLMSNTEDAYGFPPYAEIEAFLQFRDGQDLRPLERRIVEDAFRGRPTVRIRRSDMTWWSTVAQIAIDGVGTERTDEDLANARAQPLSAPGSASQ